MTFARLSLRASTALVTLAAMVCACGGAGRDAPSRNATDDTNRDNDRGAARIEADEAALFRALASVDARLAIRFGATRVDASDGAASGGAASDALDAFDVFAFDRRARVLDDAARAVDSWRYPLRGGADVERRLVARMVAEERARVAAERGLPRSASELVRAVVAGWSAADAGSASAKRRDVWLAEHLDEVRRSLADAPLTLDESNELDDALDALERIADGYAATAKSLASLRVALGEHAAATSAGRWDEVRAGLATYLGVTDDAPALRALFEAEEKRLRAEIVRRERGATQERVREADETSAALVLVDGRCDGRGSPIRAAAPPPERAAICGAARVAAESRGNVGDLAARLALHDDIVVGLWVLAIRADGATVDRATSRHRPLGYLPPEREGPLVRRAAVRAVAVLGAARAVAAMTSGGDDHLRERAARRLAFGDAPLDIAEHERRD